MVKNSSKKICPDNRPSFFKIVYPGYTTEHLRIPPDFMKNILKEASETERAILRSPTGSHWQVKLSNTTNGTYLQDGWQDFLSDHSLGDNEFLLFTYDGDMCFNVQIFDKSGCERTYVFINKINQESAFSNVSKKRGRPPKHSVGSTHLTQSKSCKDDPGQHRSFPKSDRLMKIKTKTVTQKKIKKKGIGLPVQEMDSYTRCCLSKRQPATEEERARVWKAAESFTSKFPYFTRRLNPSNVYKVFVLPLPKFFSTTHLPNYKAKIVLRNPKGKTWIVNSVPGRRTYAFCGGWPAFVHGNKLEEGDICTFELVNRFEMHVHIFRLVKEVKFEVDERL
ncbi:hypothetical protein HHK36_008447 [Tetracentron sinense]|uniref:TF-B3 domain-containing protein n=1 Tax=Tetracentron sinense TaxID=13715 RepID=A0A834ZJ18_TETSI|nr:hypothetical protein HHK36_008447 [Tetracentron sinense]